MTTIQMGGSALGMQNVLDGMYASLADMPQVEPRTMASKAVLDLARPASSLEATLRKKLVRTLSMPSLSTQKADIGSLPQQNIATQHYILKSGPASLKPLDLYVSSELGQTKMVCKEPRIAVAGAGIFGTGIATAVHRHGYDDVSIIEKNANIMLEVSKTPIHHYHGALYGGFGEATVRECVRDAYKLAFSMPQIITNRPTWIALQKNGWAKSAEQSSLIASFEAKKLRSAVKFAQDEYAQLVEAKTQELKGAYKGFGLPAPLALKQAADDAAIYGNPEKYYIEYSLEQLHEIAEKSRKQAPLTDDEQAAARFVHDNDINNIVEPVYMLRECGLNMRSAASLLQAQMDASKVKQYMNTRIVDAVRDANQFTFKTHKTDLVGENMTLAALAERHAVSEMELLLLNPALEQLDGLLPPELVVTIPGKLAADIVINAMGSGIGLLHDKFLKNQVAQLDKTVDFYKLDYDVKMAFLVMLESRQAADQPSDPAEITNHSWQEYYTLARHGDLAHPDAASENRDASDFGPGYTQFAPFWQDPDTKTVYAGLNVTHPNATYVSRGKGLSEDKSDIADIIKDKFSAIMASTTSEDNMARAQNAINAVLKNHPGLGKKFNFKAVAAMPGVLMNANTRISSVEMFAIEQNKDTGEIEYHPLETPDEIKNAVRSKIKFDTYCWVKATKAGAIARIASNMRRQVDLMTLLNGHDLPVAENGKPVAVSEEALLEGGRHITSMLNLPENFARRWNLALPTAAP